ncbi:MAG: hypothetical protein KatS3mg087_1187 [Patescibacteria group bacterium]|nr:MAG: hypothetical protein KatS3mg087_1187 [Patescibacteria group bacterium]
MATTARTAPTGKRLSDGFSTKIAFAADPDVTFWEISVTPPGWDGGDKIDDTTMFNTAYRTFAPRKLIEGTDISAVVAYDPKVINEILALINVNGWITVHFPNGDTLDFVGYLKSFVPSELSEGERPTADITIVVTNRLDTGVETAPVFTDNST